MSTLSDRVVAVCDQTLECVVGPDVRRDVLAVRDRLAEPLRVAIAGRVNTGKSTLVNALLGEQVAETANGECTRIPTWYRYNWPERATLRLIDGTVRPLALNEKGALPTSLGVPLAQVASIEVQRSNAVLKTMTLIDTPGLDSADESLSARTTAVLAVQRQAVADADALVYVMTLTARADDAAILREFRAQSSSNSASPLNAIGLLNKADRLPDAARLAAQCAQALTGMVADVIPVSGLFAETAATMLNEDDARALLQVSRLATAEREDLLDSVAAFREDAGCPVSSRQRERLLDLLGISGIGQAVSWIDAGDTGARALVQRLRRASGLDAAQAQIRNSIHQRADALKTDRALAGLARIAFAPAAGADRPALVRLRSELDDLRLDPVMHPLEEVWAMQQLSERPDEFETELVEDLRRLCTKRTAAAKLGLARGASADERRAAAAHGARRWQAFATHELTTPAGSRVARIALRSYTALWERT